jgi:predicted nucleic acid-binding protein
VNLREVASLLKDLEILAYDVEVAFHVARIHVALSGRGETNGVEDGFIAGIAVRRGEPLVARNLSRFTGVPGLKV